LARRMAQKIGVEEEVTQQIAASSQFVNEEESVLPVSEAAACKVEEESVKIKYVDCEPLCEMKKMSD
jgi:hypothetical protein